MSHADYMPKSIWNLSIEWMVLKMFYQCISVVLKLFSQRPLHKFFECGGNPFWELLLYSTYLSGSQLSVALFRLNCPSHLLHCRTRKGWDMHVLLLQLGFSDKPKTDKRTASCCSPSWTDSAQHLLEREANGTAGSVPCTPISARSGSGG